MVNEFVQVERQANVVWIRLTRTAKKNALTAGMYRAMTAAIQAADKDESVAAVVLTGSADSFTAGNDLHDFLNMDTLDDSAPPFEFLYTLSRITVPLVAGVNGLAIGIGTTILLHCDLVYATEQAKFALPFVHLGLVPEAASSLLLPQSCGYLQAAELLLLGDAFDAQQALHYRLVNEVLPEGQLAEKLTLVTEQLAARPSSSLRASKALLKAPSETVAERIQREAEVFAKALQSPAAKAAIAKRLKPKH